VQLHVSGGKLRDGGHSGESFNAATATGVYWAVWSQYERRESSVLEEKRCAFVRDVEVKNRVWLDVLIVAMLQRVAQVIYVMQVGRGQLSVT